MIWICENCNKRNEDDCCDWNIIDGIKQPCSPAQETCKMKDEGWGQSVNTITNTGEKLE